MNKEQVNPARSLYYGLMSKMFVFTTEANRFEGVEEALEVMIANPMDDNSHEALKELKEFINMGGYELLASEYDDIFHNPETKVVRNTASYYDEGVESGNKRVEVKNFLAKTKIRRNEAVFKENEDSVGFLVTFMHELIELIINDQKSYETVEHCLFTEVINGFFDEFVENLYENEKANAYKSLAVVLNAFMEFERLYFDVLKPVRKEKPIKKEEPCEIITEAEAQRRAINRAKREADSLKTSCSLENNIESAAEEV